MTTDCSLNYKFITKNYLPYSLHENSKLRTWGEHVVCSNCSECQNKKKEKKMFAQHVRHMFLAFCFHVLVCIGKSMNSLLSYCGLVDVRINASDNDLPLTTVFKTISF